MCIIEIGLYLIKDAIECKLQEKTIQVCQNDVKDDYYANTEQLFTIHSFIFYIKWV